MKKIISLLLAVIMVVGLMPVMALAQIEGKADNGSNIEGSLVEGNAKYVSANASGDQLEVIGNVTGVDGLDSVNASNGAEIIVTGTVTNDIEDSGKSAVSASSGANVSTGNVIAGSGNLAIFAVGGKTTVTAEGVEESGDVYAAIYAGEGATVTVNGDVKEDGAGDAIFAKDDNTTVTVKGNVNEKGAGDAINAEGGATVIVEGLVTGQLNTNGQTNSGTIYLGKLNGNIKEDADLSKIHYLIGTDANSAKLSDVTLVSDIVVDGTIGGVNEEGYRYTTTANATALNGKTITLKPADGKILTVSGFDGADVTYVANEDGTVTFTIGDSFTGGLQNLVLKLTDKPVHEEPERRSYTTVTIGDRDDKEETKTEEVKEETNPDTGAPVMDLGAVAVVFGAVYVVFKKH